MVKLHNINDTFLVGFKSIEELSEKDYFYLDKGFNQIFKADYIEYNKSEIISIEDFDRNVVIRGEDLKEVKPIKFYTPYKSIYLPGCPQLQHFDDEFARMASKFAMEYWDYKKPSDTDILYHFSNGYVKGYKNALLEHKFTYEHLKQVANYALSLENSNELSKEEKIEKILKGFSKSNLPLAFIPDINFVVEEPTGLSEYVWGREEYVYDSFKHIKGTYIYHLPNGDF
jgi:hypothetical protein